MKNKWIKTVIVGVSLLALLFLGGCGSSDDSQEESAVEENVAAVETEYADFGEKALANATELARRIDQADLDEMLSENTEHCDGAKNIEKTIGAYMDENPEITYAYIIRYTDESKDAAEFLINWEDTDEYWGEEFELYDESIAALNGEAIYDKEPTTDEDGTVITGYAPVKVGDQVPIVVCVDYAVETD